MQYATGPDDLMAYVRGLEARIRQLETAAPLRNATISDGGQLRVNGVNGNRLVLMGRLDDDEFNAPDGHKQMVFLLWRETGEALFQMLDGEPTIDGFRQYWAFYDIDGNQVVSDDATSGQGLARPWLPAVFTDYPAYPTQTTTSGSWTTVQRAAAYVKQHPRFQAGVLVRSESGTTGEVRLWDDTNGAQIGSTLTIPANDYQAYNIGPADLGGAHMEGIDIDLQVRRTGGSGTVGAYVTTAFGVQS